MATTLTSECNLLVVPFSAATDFTDLAEYCDRVANAHRGAAIRRENGARGRPLPVLHCYGPR